MNNNFTSPMNLPFMSEYRGQRESQINTIINNLKIGDVKDDTSFAATTSRIKRSILVTPVSFEEPRFIDHVYEERSLTMQQQMSGMNRSHYIHKLSFPFSGDRDLFSLTPDGGFSYSTSDHGLILPDTNHVIIYVDLPELNPEKAIVAARNLLSMTRQFVDKNNASSNSWNVAIEKRIGEQLKTKREELIKLFGNK